MLKRFATGALVGLAASLSLSSAVRAATVTFDDRIFLPDPINGSYGAQPTANGFTEQGLNFYTNEAFVVPKELSCALADLSCTPVFPTTFSSNFWETYGEDVVITAAGGGLFDLTSLNLGLGLGYPGEPDEDTVKVSWVKDGATYTQDVLVTVGLGFHQIVGLTGVSSVTVGPTNVQRYLAFDNVNFVDNSAIPEPTAWALMIVGFAGVGAMIRRRRAAAIATAA